MQNSDVTLVHASYPADRRYMLTAHFGCHLLERDPDLWLTDCDTTAASSGGPVFVQRNGNLRLRRHYGGSSRHIWFSRCPYCQLDRYCKARLPMRDATCSALACSGVDPSSIRVMELSSHEPTNNVRYWHKADMLNALTNVRYGGKADMPDAFVDVR